MCWLERVCVSSRAKLRRCTTVCGERRVAVSSSDGKEINMYCRIDTNEQHGVRTLTQRGSRRWHLRGAYAVAGLAWLMWTPVVLAQDVPNSLDELLLSGKLERGHHIFITDSAGQRIEGDVIDISSTALSVGSRRGTWTFTDGELHSIERRDSLANGIWLGAGAGLGAFYSFCGPKSGLVRCLRVLHSAGAIFTAIGAFIGWSIDSQEHEAIYMKSGGTQLSVSTMLATEHVGARVSVGW